MFLSQKLLTVFVFVTALTIASNGVLGQEKQADKSATDKSKGEQSTEKQQNEQESQKKQSEKSETPAKSQVSNDAPSLEVARNQYKAAIEKWKGSFKEVHKALRNFATCKREDAEKWRNAWHTAIAEGNRRRDAVADAAMVLARVGKGTRDGAEASMISTKMIGFDAKTGRYTRAYKMCKEYYEMDPKNYTVIAQLALICLKTNRFDQAQELLDKLHAQKITGFDGQFRTLKGLKANWKEELKIREKEKGSNLPVVRITTSQGSIDVELFENQAPNTVANFIHLTRIGFYNGKKFHRTLPGFMAQGGCPNGTGSGDAGYSIKDEHHGKNIRKHFRGVISMANTGAPNSGGSQFFLTFSPQPQLDGRHTAFGRIIKGEEVLDRFKITHKQVTEQGEQKEKPIDGLIHDKIIKVEVLSAPDKEYTPKKIELP